MFREDKATHLAAYLINRSGGTCSYLTLLKMMYHADREMLLRWGMPITFDTWVSTKNGPVLSSIYNQIINEKPNTSYWGYHISTAGTDVVLTCGPGDDSLSDAEIQAADKGFGEFGALSYNQAIKHAHKIFSEWKDPGVSGSIPITYEDVLRENGQTSPEFLNEVKMHCQLNDLFAR